MKRKIFITSLLIAGLVVATALIAYRAGRHSLYPETKTIANEKGQKKDSQRKILYWKAPMNPSEIYDHPGKSKMGMDLIPVYAGDDAAEARGTVKIDPVTVQNMGVRLAMVKEAGFSSTIRAVGKLEYNEKKLYTVTTKFSGWIDKLYANYTGQLIKKGDPLLTIYSPDLVTTQQEYLLALKTRNELRNSPFETIQDNGETLLKASKKRLQYWDIPLSEINSLEKKGTIQKNILMRAPASGVVVHTNIEAGMHIKEGMNLMKIADLSTVWVEASIYDYELPWVHKGQKAEVQLSYLPGTKIYGRVSYIYPDLDEKDRTVTLRIVLRNPDLELKPGMFANIYIKGKSISKALVIPDEAVIRTGKRNIVFVALGNGRFLPREVTLGPEGGPENNDVQVLSGLQAGEQIVTSSQFLLDSESRLQEAIQKMLESKPTERPGMKSNANMKMPAEKEKTAMPDSNKSMPSNKMVHKHSNNQ